MELLVGPDDPAEDSKETMDQLLMTWSTVWNRSKKQLVSNSIPNQSRLSYII